MEVLVNGKEAAFVVVPGLLPLVPPAASLVRDGAGAGVVEDGDVGGRT